MLFGVAPALLSAASGSACSAKYLCYAIVAAGIGLAWGRGGMLTLGQGVFFGLGAYMMGMHLKIADAGIRNQAVPDFMQIAGIPGAARLLGTVLLAPPSRCWRSSWSRRPSPRCSASGVFKRRVKGAYFAILSQALAAALAILLVGQATLGGSNGLNGFRTFFGFTAVRPGEPADAVLHRRRRCC